MHSELYDAVKTKYSSDTPAPVLEENALANEQYLLFRRAYMAGHKDWLADSAKFDAFYRGDQWEESLRAQLEMEGRPALTINVILSTINVILGEQITSRLDIAYRSRCPCADDDKTGFAITKLAASIMAENRYRWVESQVFADGVIQDRGYFDIRMDWTKKIEGSVKITALDPSNVVIGIDAKEADPETWPDWWYTRWVSVDDVALEYGDEIADKVRSLADQGLTYGADSIRTVENTFGGGATQNGLAGQGLTPGLRNTVQAIRLIERQFKQNVRIHYLVDPSSGERRALPVGTTKVEAAKLAKQYGALHHPVTEQRIRWRVTADRFVLHDEWSPYRTYTIRSFFPYFRRGKPFGVVRNLISPQEQFNKLSSQELHIVNSTANSGWMVEEGTLNGMTSDELAQQGSKTGLVVTVNPGRMAGLQKIQPNSIPSGIDRITSKSRDNIQNISGINASMLATESSEVSGVAMEKKIGAGQVQLSVVKDSLESTQHSVALKLLELIQDFMPHEQLVRYTEQAPSEPQAQEKTVMLNEAQEDGSVKNDVTAGDFEATIITMPSRDTANDIQFAEVIALRNVGVMIPDYRVVQYSNLEQKHDISAEMKQLSGLGEPTPEEAQAQAAQQELEMRGMTAEVAKTEGLAKQAESQAELNMAKAQEVAAQPEIQQRTLEQKHASETLGYKVRLNLAERAAASKTQTSTMSTNTAAVNKLDAIALKHHLEQQKQAQTPHETQ